MNEKRIKIGCYSAFWGDTPTAAAQLVKRGGGIDYLVGDYLAEVTMCILARAKAKIAKKGGGKYKGNAGAGGYVKEFVTFMWKPLMKPIMEQGIKVVTNAGGMNPLGLKQAIEDAARKAGVTPPVVACVEGDDLTKSSSQLLSEGKLKPFAVEGEPEQLWSQDTKLMSANAYIGARPIADALAAGAQIVITGRCVDSAIVVGPLIHEFGWKPTDFDLLSAGSLAGHIIECGAQCNGGNFTDWKDSSADNGWTDMGFPIAEVAADGSCIITKPDNTGGLVTPGTVSEQLLYEIHDPSAYMLPDVICDWTHVELKELPMSSEQKEDGAVRSDRVLITGAKGRAPSPYYKIGATNFHGYRMSATLLISGFDAYQKAHAVGNAIFERTKFLVNMRGWGDFYTMKLHCLGAEETYGPQSRLRHVSRELLLTLMVHHKNPKALAVFGMELAPSATSMAPGITGWSGGRPRPTPFIKYTSCLIEKRHVQIKVHVGDQPPVTCPDYMDVSVVKHSPSPSTALSAPEPRAIAAYAFASDTSELPSEPTVRVPLIALCWARSGDKGNVCNIGIIARKPEYFTFLKNNVTASAVKKYLPHLLTGVVTRYEMPTVVGGAFNFVCTRALGGGGTSSFNLDAQGKSYGQKLLSMIVEVPASFVAGTEWADGVDSTGLVSRL